MPRECPVTLQPLLHPVVCNNGRHYELEAIVEHCIGKTKSQLLCPFTNTKLKLVIYSFDVKVDLDNEYNVPGAGKLEKRYDGYQKGFSKDEYMQALNEFFEKSDDVTPFALPLKKQAAALITEKIQPPLTDEQLWAKIDERGDEPLANVAELLQLLRLPPRRGPSLAEELSPNRELDPEQELSVIGELAPEPELSSSGEIVPEQDLSPRRELPPERELSSRQATVYKAYNKVDLGEAAFFYNAGRRYDAGRREAHISRAPIHPSVSAAYYLEYQSVPESENDQYAMNLRMFQHGMNEDQHNGLDEEYFYEDCEKDINLAKKELLNPQTILSNRHFLDLLIKHGAALLEGLPAQNPLKGSRITLENIIAAAEKRSESKQFDLGPYLLSHQALCQDLKSYDIFNIGKNDPGSAATIIDTPTLFNQLRPHQQQELNLTVNTGEGIDRRYPRSYLASSDFLKIDLLCSDCEKNIGKAKAEILNKYTTLSAKHILQLLDKQGAALLPDLTPLNLFKQTKIRLPHLVATAEKRADIGRYILAYPELWPDLKRRDVFRIGKNFATNGSIILNQAVLNNKLLEQDREELRLTMSTGESYDERQNRVNQNAVTQRPGI